MPAGYSTNDFVLLLPEIVLTAGLLVVLAADLFTRPGRQEWLAWLGAKQPVHLLPNAGNPAVWAEGEVPEDLVRGSRTLLYTGHLGGSWLHWRLIKALARHADKVGWEINLIGQPPAKPWPHSRLHYRQRRRPRPVRGVGREGQAGLRPLRL